MNKFLAACFVAFIVYVIYLANSGAEKHVFFRFAGSIPYGDKIGHFGLIGVLALLVNLAVGLKTVKAWRIGKTPVLWGSLGVSVFVLGEEVSQLFIANRTFDLMDLFCDLLGISLANWAAVIWMGRQNERANQ